MQEKLKFVFGDIHGCLRQLDALLMLIDDYAKGADYQRIFLGDYVDRGPDSAGVISRLMSLEGDNVFLMGNHESMLLDAHSGQYVLNWLKNGGYETMKSYGNEISINSDHLNWINNLQFFYEDDLRFYVHAGIDPTYPLSNQSEKDLLWIRKPFLLYKEKFDKYVVHGHSVESDVPNIQHNRCNLDTGGVFGYNFSVGVFNDTQEKPIDIIQVQGETL